MKLHLPRHFHNLLNSILTLIKKKKTTYEFTTTNPLMDCLINWIRRDILEPATTSHIWLPWLVNHTIVVIFKHIFHHPSLPTKLPTYVRVGFCGIPNSLLSSQHPKLYMLVGQTSKQLELKIRLTIYHFYHLFMCIIMNF